MTKRKLAPVHPGEILKYEYLEPLGLSATAFAKAIGVPPNRVTRLMAGASAVTADTALRLAKALRTSPDMWMNLQSRYELDMAEDRGVPLATISPIVA